MRISLHHFADILTYPSPSLPEVVRSCQSAVAGTNPDAGKLLRKFASFVERTPLPLLEEEYTKVFDLDPKCFPSVGYHLFGESYKRSVFLLGLKEHYRARGFSVDGELPDHLSVLLRYLAVTDDATFAHELIEDAILPALERMTGRSQSAGYDEQPEVNSAPMAPERAHYVSVLEALRMVLKDVAASVDGRNGARNG